MTNIVFLNNQFIEKENAKVSVLDRGFLFGDGIYEVIPVYQSVCFRLQEHLDRLQACLNKINIQSPYTSEEWESLISQVIAKNGGGNLSIYLQVTKGCDNKREHVTPSDLSPTVLIMASPLPANVAELEGINAALIEDIRWQHCDIKSTSLLGNILLRQQAENLGCQEAILHRQGQVTEGSTSNVFIVKDGTIYTPPKSQYILAGITRDLIVELAKNATIKVHEIDFTTDDLAKADEVWVSSSSREISPVLIINGKMVRNGTIGPISKQLHSLVQKFKMNLIQK